MNHVNAEQKADVLHFSKLGLSHPDIAAILEIGVDQFVDDKETLKAYALGNAEILESLYNMALSGRNASAAVFLAGRRCYRDIVDSQTLINKRSSAKPERSEPQPLQGFRVVINNEAPNDGL